MNYRRIGARICVTVSFLALGSYAVMVIAGARAVPPYLLISPSLGILAGLNYLRLTASRERGTSDE